MVHLCCMCCMSFWRVCHYIHACAVFAAVWNSVHCCCSVLSENVIFLSVFLSCMEVVYMIIFCIGCLLCNLETLPYRLLPVLVKPSAPLNLTSRSSLQKGVPKLVACLCNCWCFSFFTYFVTTCAAASLLKWTITIFLTCVHLCGAYGTHVPHLPPRRFHTQVVALLFLHLFHMSATLSRFEYWLDPHFCKNASVDTCSAKIFVEACSCMCDSGLLPGW